MNIILGLTGSVATTIAPKIIEALKGVPNCKEVRVVMTKAATRFWSANELSTKSGVTVLTDKDEWQWNENSSTETTDKWRKGLPILHIELAKWGSCLVIAPASANTIAKMAHGFCDNLLTSMYAAWDVNRPVIVAPAMNTRMLDSYANKGNMFSLSASGGVLFVSTANKTLACGDTGYGALAEVSEIANSVGKELQWCFPLNPAFISKIPTGDHPGAFGAFRKHDRHCGVDLYCEEESRVYAVENGTVISIEDFTGKSIGSPWWNETKAVKIEGPSGVVCYGEIRPLCGLSVGDKIRQRDIIGNVIPVLKKDKLRTDIPNHSCSMLHVQMYKHGMGHMDDVIGKNDALPDYIVDPTPYLIGSRP